MSGVEKLLENYSLRGFLVFDMICESLLHLDFGSCVVWHTNILAECIEVLVLARSSVGPDVRGWKTRERAVV